ncbi:M23 family metallopeptidase [Patescibacteria group bacterium]|nr:M23 family metallopeptidase [Patescibacteria group bacterium]
MMTKKIFRNLVIFRLIFALIFMSIPFSAQANVLSFVTDFFKDNVIEKTENINSQNMALLQATLNSDLNLAKGGGEITIVGDIALLPETGPSGSMADIKDQSAGDKISVYVVREGDSLSQIAKMFNVSTNTIIWANDLHKSLIKEGQTLVILPISGVQHEVIKGETLASITKKYKGNLDEILNFNNLSEKTKLTVGDIVIIPDGEVGSYSFGAQSVSKIVNSNPYRGGDGPTYGDYYIRPVNGIKSQGLHGYNAVDIAAPIGTPIFASASGQVIISKGGGWNGGYGNYIVIKHNNGTQTLYSHASENIVYVGQSVIQGQVIGYVGSTGKSTGPHVHFEVRGAKNPF